jgi:hypothetical protein
MIIELSSVKPGGGKLCQEAPRLVLIIVQIFCVFNVNFLDFLAWGVATA